MGVLPIKRLIVSMSLPMMISMLVQALYNIVDSIFVSMISEDALAAVTLVFPMQNLLIAVASGTGVGINAMLSKALGEKKREGADNAANTGLFLTFINYLFFVIIGIFLTHTFISSQTTSEVIMGYGEQYMRIICLMGVGMMFQMTFERLLQSTGKTVQSMISQMTGAIINIILDPMLIFGIGFFPKLGVAGAAYATIIGQVCAACVGLFLNIKYNTEITLSLRKILKPDIEAIGKIYFVGVPSILMMAIGSVMTYLMNRILDGFSSTAVAVFGVYFKLQSFFFMPVFGLNGGLIPVLAYNYGARRRSRIIEALKFSVVVAIVIMSIGTLCFELVPDLFLGIFKASDTMLKIGEPALRIIGIHFPVAAISIVLGSVFQAFSRSYYSLAVSLGRQLVVLIPVAWLMAKTGNVQNVWWSFPIAEVISFVITIVCFVRVKKSVIDGLSAE